MQGRGVWLNQMKQQQSRGRRNWLKLKNIIRSGTLGTKGKDKKFKLFQKDIQHTKDHIITTYSHDGVVLLQRSPLPNYKQMLHFQGEVDATGNWVWEAEEIAAYFFIHQGQNIIDGLLARHEGKSLGILELGAGSSGLAGIALAQLTLRHFQGIQVKLCLTDGQIHTIPFLAENLRLNLPQKSAFSAKRLLWGELPSLQNSSQSQPIRKQYEIIIICDCLYFVAFHKQLLFTIDTFLAPNGSVYIIGPQRGDSMSQFLSLAMTAGFVSEFITFKNAAFEAEVAQLRQAEDFTEDKHFPHFVRVARKNI